MLATATMPAYKSPSHTHSHSHSRSSHSRPSTTPRGPAPSAGKAMSPLLTPHAYKQHASHQPRSPSPSYFGLLVAGDSDPQGSSAGQHAWQNWENVSSEARSVAPAPAPRTVPVDANHQFEAFRRQSETNKFNLSQGNLSSFARPAQSRQSTKSSIESPISPRTSHTTYKTSNENMNRPLQERDGKAEPQAQSYFDIPRNTSPGPMSPRQLALADHQHARLSLPSNRLQTPPIDTARKLHRADTLPLDLEKENPTMITPQQLSVLVEALPREILLLDLRVFPHFASSRVRGALNLCIPTTLLKRPSFSVQKLADTFTAEADQLKFAHWKECRYIVLYDANTAHIKDAATSINVLKKFSSEGWMGQGLIIKGGFLAVSRVAPDAIDKSPVGQTGGAAKQVLSIKASAHGAVPVAGGCQMPTSKSAANPFFGNIRQNMDLLDGVGQMPIKRPAGFSEEAERRLPRWLREACKTDDEGKLVSDRFLVIEKDEQKRMQQALSCNVSYGSPTGQAQKLVQIAGIEKGSKNRYNNIFPYDHSRVRLQGEPPEGCDYVNANHVKASFSNKHYIATQAPIPATFNDFWRVVWEQDARVIVMLTAESEGGQVKSHPYWHAGTYGPLKLKNLSEKRVSLVPNNAITNNATTKRPSIGQRRSTAPVAAKEKSQDHAPPSPTSDTPSVIVRQFTLSHSSYPFEPMREITQLHYSGWPDFGAPADPHHLLGLIEQTNKYAQRTSGSPTTSSFQQTAAERSRKWVVHCSAGCGRTGTFCTIDSVIEMLKRQRTFRRLQAHQDAMDIDSEDNWLRRGDVDLIAKTVEDFRLQRLSMVQNLRQFVLCYEAVLQWVVDEQARS
jgi:tyrosine-protein phosphatase 2/3